MGLMQTIRGLFGSGKAQKQADATAKRDEAKRTDDAFRKAMRGNDS